MFCKTNMWLLNSITLIFFFFYHCTRSSSKITLRSHVRFAQTLLEIISRRRRWLAFFSYNENFFRCFRDFPENKFFRTISKILNEKTRRSINYNGGRDGICPGLCDLKNTTVMITTITGAARIAHSTVDDARPRPRVGATGRPLLISTFAVAATAIFPVRFLRGRRALRAKRFFAVPSPSPSVYLVDKKRVFHGHCRKRGNRRDDRNVKRTRARKSDALQRRSLR